MTVSSGFGKNSNCWEISKQITRLGMTVIASVSNWLHSCCSAQPHGSRHASRAPMNAGDCSLQPPSCPCLWTPTHDRHSSWPDMVQGCQTPQRVSRRTHTATLQQPTLSQASPKEPSSCPGGEILVVRCLRVWRKEVLPPNNFMGLGVPFLWIQESFQHTWTSSVCLLFLRLPFAQRHLMDCGKKLAKVMNSRHFVFTE